MNMNIYYHNFSLGFNLWYVIAPLLLCVIGVLGGTRYYLANNLKVKVRYKDRLFQITAICFAVIVCAMMFAESYDGAIQWVDNVLGWGRMVSRLLAAVGIFLAGTAYGLLSYMMAYHISEIKRRYVRYKRDEIKRSVRKENEERAAAERIERNRANIIAFMKRPLFGQEEAARHQEEVPQGQVLMLPCSYSEIKS